MSEADFFKEERRTNRYSTLAAEIPQQHDAIISLAVCG